VKELNRKFINERRIQLLNLLKKRRAALSHYLSSLGPTLSEQEVKIVQNTTDNIESEIKTLELRRRGDQAPNAKALNSPLAPLSEVTSAPRVSQRDGGMKADGIRFVPAVIKNPVPLAEQGNTRGDLAIVQGTDILSKKAKADATINSATSNAALATAQDASCASCSPSACPICDLPPGDAKRRIVIDARGGSATGARKYRKGQNAQVVIINKNPYIKKYTTEIKGTTIEETAIKTFAPLLGGIVADTIGTTKDETAKGKATDSQKALAATDCPSDEELRDLEKEKNDGQGAENRLRTAYEELAAKHKQVVSKYQTGVEKLRNPRIQCEAMYCASVNLRNDLGGRVDDSEVKAVQDKNDELEAQAVTLRAQARRLKIKYSNCDLDFVDEVLIFAEGLLARVKTANTNLKKISDDNKTFEKTVETIKEVTGDERNFVEVHEIPEDRSTDIVEIKLSAKNLKELGGEPEDKSNDITTVKVQFGDAPYFSITGGIAVSTLEKTEFQRVQGFAANRQGEVVGTQLTSIVGVKEDSSTRISPLLMLHGRLYRPQVERFLSGIHWSLGITGKNDNKGTDIEYLIGPSFSFLNDQAFLTIGGYAGKRQELEGNLFPGAEVPKDLAEIPVRKNYHWKIGFGLTYRIPLPK
jgi:hypothetical protein